MAKDRRKVYGKPELTADSGTRLVFSAEQPEGEAEAIANLVVATDQSLKLCPSQAGSISDSTIAFDPERQPRIEIMQQRQATRVHMAAPGLNSDRPGAGVTRKQETEVRVHTRFFGEWLLRNSVQPVVGQPGTQPILFVTSRKLDIQTRA